jgi:hypothetical protein
MALSTINPSYLSWKQQGQLIISVILSSLSTEVLHLAVDCQTSHALWTTLTTALASPSNSRIMQLHGSFQDLRQNDSTVSAYLQQAKMLFDELVAAGRPLSMEDFNLYVFRGLRGEFRDLVTTLSTRAEPISYTDLHSLLLTHEFLHKASLQPVVAALLLPTPSQPPQPSSHSVSHGLQVTTITKILVAGVAFVEDGRFIIVAISIMVLDSLLDRILGNKEIVLGAPVSGQIRKK